ncbi:MAG TPA: DUF1476 domain-containing protein [Stellaceae bacterium]|nr:DUF1476 domain-containing protein [Stellaceae bacterium]
MKSFAERGKAFEAEFKRDQELAFRITARRNRLFGLWAAARLGLPAGEAADAYAKTVVAADFEVPGDADVIAKVRADLAEKGIAATEADLRAELARFGAEARRQLSEN